MMARGLDEIWFESQSPNLSINQRTSSSSSDNNTNKNNYRVSKSLTTSTTSKVKKCQSKNIRSTTERRNNNNNNIKGVGSRRIFSPIFKLQVLDSYRQDADCQGNQRATARKYGIHRRQIQKWLQMETSLRMSVQQQSSTSSATAAIASSSSSSSSKCSVTNTSSTTSTATALNLSSSVANKYLLQKSKIANNNQDIVKSANNNNNNVSSTGVELQLVSSISANAVVFSSNNDSRYYALSRASSTTSSSSCSSSFKENNLSSSDLEEEEEEEEYINVDEVTDTEDEIVDNWNNINKNNNNNNCEKALDFTRATLSKRRFYTTDFKLHVLNAFRVDPICKGNQRATARKFGIHRRQVQKWLNRENLIRNEHFNSVGNLCLDLSQQSSSSSKRKQLLVDEESSSSVSSLSSLSDDFNAAKRRKSASYDDDVIAAASPLMVDFVDKKKETVQESALCLVKEKPNNPVVLSSDHNQEIQETEIYSHERSSYNVPVGFSSPVCGVDYATGRPVYCFCSPWTCCYQHTTAGSGNLVETSSYPQYMIDLKFQNTINSYVDIPLQYGFGESLTTAAAAISPKWIKESPSSSSSVVGPFSLHEHSTSTLTLYNR